MGAESTSCTWGGPQEWADEKMPSGAQSPLGEDGPRSGGGYLEPNA